MINLCILIPALVGILSGILGCFLGKLTSKGNENNSDLFLKSDLNECRANSNNLLMKIQSLETDMANAKASAAVNLQSFVKSVDTISAGITAIPYNSDLAFSILGKKFKQDDLKVVEGIGSKIEELFQNAGINTWKSLSETPVEKLQMILEEAGDRFSNHNPSTWSKQAALAYLGQWQELKTWQDSLDGGKEKE
jgi:predicted flap endonuclease-1-like 5' DNA nuclease